MTANVDSIAVRRLLEASRAPELLALVHAAFARLPIDPPSSVLKESVDDFAARIRADIALISEADSVLVGCVFCTRRSDSLYIGRLTVREDWRRRGVAGALLNAAKDQARALGLRRLELSTRIALTGNIRLFAAHGFTITAAQRHAGFEAPTSYDMALELASGEPG